MHMGEHFNVLGENADWFQIYFTENPGMAFGLELGGDYGKLALSLFRIVAVVFITYYLFVLVKSKKSYGLIASISLIWAGAVGNILDSMFYGLIFSGSQHGIAHVTSFGAGYANFLHGRVVDMLYFPLIEGNYPSWFPVIGGRHFQFFQPIFNIADTSISVGVGMVIVFYRRFFKDFTDKPVIESLTPPVVGTTDGSDAVVETLDMAKTEGEVLDDKIVVETTVKIKTTIETTIKPTDRLAETGMDIPMDEEED
jgi:signal peptidase II